MKTLRVAIFPFAAAMSLAGAAQAQDGAIWVQCELAPGSSPYGNFIGVMRVGNGTLRSYDPATRSLGDDFCASSGGDRSTLCTLTSDAFVYDSSSGGGTHHYQGSIDRRTGRAWFTYENNAYSMNNFSSESVCRGTTDPRPATQF